MGLDQLYSAGLPMQHDPRKYAEGNQLQRTLFRIITDVFPIEWNPADVVLDVGCGTGEVSHLMLDGNNSLHSMVGVDLSPSFIEYARSNNREHRVTFQVADAAGEWPREWTSHFSKVVSFMALHFVKNQPRFLRNAFAALRPGGSIYVSLLYESVSFHDAVVELPRSERWGKYFSEKAALAMCAKSEWRQPDVYLRMMKDAGFTVRHVSLVPVTYDFVDEEAALLSFRGVNMFGHYIPEEQRDEFERDFMNEVNKIEETLHGSRLRRQMTFMVAAGTKPT